MQLVRMYLKNITDLLVATYKVIDLRLIIIENGSEIAFLRIYFSKNPKISKKNASFFNSISEDIRFVHEILDITQTNSLMAGLRNGELKLNGSTYRISNGEANYLNDNLDNDRLYSKWVQDLYSREQEFPFLLILPPFDMTCGGILATHGIKNSIKGYNIQKIIHSFLDASSINNTNSRIVLLLPIYCILKRFIYDFEVLVHKELASQISLRLLNGDPRSIPLSDIIKDNSSILAHYLIEDDLIKGASHIGIYHHSLEIELFNEPVISKPSKPPLPNIIRHETKQESRLLIERDESKFLERKPFLIGKEFDVMKTIDSFLNTEGGVLIIGQGDDKRIIGLDNDYNKLEGDRENFDKFKNHLRKLIKDKFFQNAMVWEFIDIERIGEEDKDVCIIDIRKSHIPVFVYYEGKQYFYVRQIDNSTKLERYELSSYIIQHFCKAYDENSRHVSS